MSENANKGVSPVIAVILMVAVTVVLSAIVGTFVFNLGQDMGSESVKDVGVSVSTTEGNVTAQVITGQADELKLLVNGSKMDNLTDVVPGDSLSANISADSDVTVVSVTNGDSSIVYSGSPIIGGGDTSLTAPTTGLVSHFKFESGSGSIAIDSAGSNDGTFYGNISWTTNSKVGSYALSFDGSGDYVLNGSPSGLPTGDTPMSIAVWMNIDTHGKQGLASWGNNSQNDVFGLLDTSSSMAVQGWGGSYDWHTGHSSATETWVHLTATYDGSVTTYYVNGSYYADNSTFTFSPTDNKLAIGAEVDKDAYYGGELDDVRIYNRSLSASEVDELYNATK